MTLEREGKTRHIAHNHHQFRPSLKDLTSQNNCDTKGEKREEETILVEALGISLFLVQMSFS